MNNLIQIPFVHDEEKSLDSCTQNIKKIYLGVSTDVIKTTSFEYKLLLSSHLNFFFTYPNVYFYSVLIWKTVKNKLFHPYKISLCIVCRAVVLVVTSYFSRHCTLLQYNDRNKWNPKLALSEFASEFSSSWTMLYVSKNSDSPPQQMLRNEQNVSYNCHQGGEVK